MLAFYFLLPVVAMARLCGYCMDIEVGRHLIAEDYEGVLVPRVTPPSCDDPKQYLFECDVGCFQLIVTMHNHTTRMAKGCNDQVFNTPRRHDYRKFVGNEGPLILKGSFTDRYYSFEFCSMAMCYSNVYAEIYNYTEHAEKEKLRRSCRPGRTCPVAMKSSHASHPLCLMQIFIAYLTNTWISS